MRAASAIVALTLLMGAPLAQAQNKLTHANYAEARQLYDEFGKTLNRVMLWQKKTPQERAASLKQATAHQARISKLFGDFSQCAYAASHHVNFVSDLNKLVSAGEGAGSLDAFELLGALSAAERFGNHRGACYYAVEALDTPTKK